MSVLASGDYRYWRDGALQAIAEPWQLHLTDGGFRLRGQRLVDGKPLLDVNAGYHDGRCTDLQVRWQTPSRELGVRYQQHGDHLQWQFDHEPTRRVLALPAGSQLFPLLRAATGPLLRQLLPAPATVVVPCIRNPEAMDFLHPLLSERRTRVEHAADRHYRYQGGEYGETGCDCWLDENGLLQRYRWVSPQGEWSVRLETLQATPEFTGFLAMDRSRPGVAR